MDGIIAAGKLDWARCFELVVAKSIPIRRGEKASSCGDGVSTTRFEVARERHDGGGSRYR